MRYHAILLLVGCCHAVQAEPLGRLFFSPAERRLLDAPSAVDNRQEARRIDGSLRHPDGRTTFWLGGQLQPAARTAGQHAPVIGEHPQQPLLPANSLRIERQARR